MRLHANPSRKAILFDCTLCIGCGACSLACKQAKGLDAEEVGQAEPPKVGGDGLSANTLTAVTKRSGRFVRQLCLHCEVPTCASACPVKAIEKTAAGPVVYREERCIGCRYCMQACPMSIPRYEWNSLTPRIRKCDFCARRVAQGLKTACAQVCPTGATRFGDREELIEEARARIAAGGSRYTRGIFGETELGGTSVLILSDVPFEALGLPVELGDEPLADLTFKVLRKLPSAVLVGTLFLGGVWWITRRRDEVSAWRDETAHESPP